MGALLDPSERPLRTEEKREEKAHFSQGKKVRELGTCLFSCLETQESGEGRHVAQGPMLGGVLKSLSTNGALKLMQDSVTSVHFD